MAERNMEHIRLSDGFRGIAILRTYPEIGTAGLQAGCRAGLLTRTSLLRRGRRQYSRSGDRRYSKR